MKDRPPILVVKCGGSAGVDLAAVCRDIALLVGNGERVIVAHGGSVAANDLGRQLGRPARFLTSPAGVRSRYTDAATLDVLTMAMAGHINPTLVAQLLALGVDAVGLSGVDGALIQAKRKAVVKAVVDGKVRLVRDNLTGKICGVNAALLTTLLEAGYVPVVSPPAVDLRAGPLNVDADRAAAALAVAAQAERLIILTNTPGLLRDPADPSTLIETVPAGGFDDCLQVAQGRMKLKLIASREALAGGVGRVVLADGRRPAPISEALAGNGTILEPAALAAMETQP